MKVWRRAVVIAAVRLDGTVAAGARAADVSVRTVYRLMASDSAFAEQVETARHQHEADEAAAFYAKAARMNRAS